LPLCQLREAKLAEIRAAEVCPHSVDTFTSYVEDIYLPFIQCTKKPSTYAGYRTYFERYIKPRVGNYALRDFTVAVVAALLKDIAKTHQVNTDTVTKIRSILSGIFTYALSQGHFPGRSSSENPACRVRIPESAAKPEPTFGATRDEWDRTREQIAVRRSVWHAIEGTTKTPQSNRFVTVTEELRATLLALWNSQGSPLGGYILAHPNGERVNLDNRDTFLNATKPCRTALVGTLCGDSMALRCASRQGTAIRCRRPWATPRQLPTSII